MSIFEINETLEKKIQSQNRSFKELAMKQEDLKLKVDEFLKELAISPEQLTNFIENKDNFTEENWQTIQSLREELDKKLERELSNVQNPLKNKKAYRERIVQQHWLFVR